MTLDHILIIYSTGVGLWMASVGLAVGWSDDPVDDGTWRMVQENFLAAVLWPLVLPALMVTLAGVFFGAAAKRLTRDTPWL